MPKIRTLKPEHRQHRKVGPLSHFNYRLWVGMICEADDDGRLVADVFQLRALIFAYHPKVTIKHVADGLEELAAVGLIHLFTVGETRYVEFPSWRDHQRIRADHYTPSMLPSPLTESSVVPVGGPSGDHKGTTREPAGSQPGAGSDRIGKERKGSERKGGSVREGNPNGHKVTRVGSSKGGVFADTLAAIKSRHPELNDPDAEAAALQAIEAEAKRR